MAITKATGGVIKDGEITGAKLAAGAAASTDNVSLLGFKVATADSLAIFNMKDGIIDDYNDATGVDASASTNEVRDSSGKFYFGGTAGQNATGGTITNVGGNRIHTFGVGNTNFVSPGTTTVSWLVVAGGGSAGTDSSGGGGAGGYRTGASHPITAQTYGIVVGAGTTWTSSGIPAAGGVSTFDTVTSAGGGAGGGNVTPLPGQSQGEGQPGGSGGGARRSYSVPGGSTTAITPITGETTTVQGYIGGQNNSTGGSSGGGGAGQVGGVGGGGGRGGDGGDGVASSISGSSVTYGGGGAGAAEGAPWGGTGGSGGGGPANTSNSPGFGTSGTDGLGGGGGGGYGGNTAGDGGNGVVIISYVEDSIVGPGANMTLVSNAQTAQAAPTNTRICMLMDPTTGTTTINTDIKAYVSRDNGTTYSQATLVDEGTYSGTQKILASTVDVSGQPSGTSMRYKIETLNQSGSKETSIYGTSLSWL
jgi:hypothetical protein